MSLRDFNYLLSCRASKVVGILQSFVYSMFTGVFQYHKNGIFDWIPTLFICI